MKLKDYADVLRFAIKLQINYNDEAIIKAERDFKNTEYLEGIKAGLQIALQKIDDSNFLLEKYN